MAHWMHVDNSNFFIEGKRVSAVLQGEALDIFDSVEHNILDQACRFDFGKLYEFVGNGIARAMLFGSRPPPNDSLWAMAESAGFEVVVYDRNVANKEKMIDTEITFTMARDAYTRADKAEDIFTLVAGDGDYVPAVKALVADGFRVEVAFWNHASRGLKDSCTKFISLDEHFDELRL